MIKPNERPCAVELSNDLDSLQTAVSIGASEQGLIEFVYLEDNVSILCNEEGKLIGLEPNRRLGCDILCGVFYVTGNGEEDLSSLSEENIEAYKKIFEKPDTFSPGDVERTINSGFFVF